MDSDSINVPDAIRVIAAALQDARYGLKLRTEQKSLFKNVKNCFIGSDAVDAMNMYKTVFHAVDRAQGQRLCQHLIQAQYIVPMEKSKTENVQFKDDRSTLYYFKVYPLALDPGYMEKYLTASAKRLIATDPAVVQHISPGPESSKPISPRDKPAQATSALPQQPGKGPARPQLIASQSSPQVKRAALAAPTSGSSVAGRSSHIGLDTSGPVRDAAAAREAAAAGSSMLDDDDDGNGITYQIDSTTGANVIKLATEERLIEKLTQENTEVSFIKTFIAVYQSFMTPSALLQRIIARYLQCTSSEENDKRKTIIQLRVFSVLKMWIESDFDDFDDGMRISINDFIVNKVGANQQNAVATLKRTLEKKENIGSSDPVLAAAITDEARDVSFLDVDVSDLAKAITATEHDLYAAIKRREFLKLAWAKPGKEQNAPNILRMIDHTNQLIRWVTAEICTTLQLKQRGQVLAKFIALAQRLFSMNNFNGLMEILAALNSAPVRRLKNTWAELSDEQAAEVKKLESVMSHESSYKNYRAALKGASPPAVPYLGTFLTDITFIEEGNKSKIDDMIHYYKWNLVGRHILQIQQFQSIHGFAAPSDRRLLSYCAFIKTKGVTDAEAYNLSLKIEPRNPSEAFEEMLMEEERLRREVQSLQLRNAQLEEEVESLKSALRVLNTKARKSMKLEGELENLRARISRSGIEDFAAANATPTELLPRPMSPRRAGLMAGGEPRSMSPRRPASPQRDSPSTPTAPSPAGSAPSSGRVAGAGVVQVAKLVQPAPPGSKEKGGEAAPSAAATPEVAVSETLPSPPRPSSPGTVATQTLAAAASAEAPAAPSLSSTVSPLAVVVPSPVVTPPVSPRKGVATITPKAASPRTAGAPLPTPIKPLAAMRASNATGDLPAPLPVPADKSPRKGGSHIAQPMTTAPLPGPQSPHALSPSTSPGAPGLLAALATRDQIYLEIPPPPPPTSAPQPLPVFSIADTPADKGAHLSTSPPQRVGGGSHVGGGGSYIGKPTTWAAPKLPGGDAERGESRRGTILLTKGNADANAPIAPSSAATAAQLTSPRTPAITLPPPPEPAPPAPQPATSGTLTTAANSMPDSAPDQMPPLPAPPHQIKLVLPSHHTGRNGCAPPDASVNNP